MSDPRLANTVKAAAKKPCLLCGRRPYVGAIFAPNAANRAKVGAPAGKIRLIVYSLCRDCFKTPDRERRVEEVIFETAAKETPP